MFHLNCGLQLHRTKTFAGGKEKRKAMAHFFHLLCKYACMSCSLSPFTKWLADQSNQLFVSFPKEKSDIITNWLVKKNIAKILRNLIMMAIITSKYIIPRKYDSDYFTLNYYFHVAMSKYPFFISKKVKINLCRQIIEINRVKIIIVGCIFLFRMTIFHPKTNITSNN